MKSFVPSRFNFITGAFIGLGVALRYSQLGFISDDLRIAFLPWFEEVTARGFSSIGENFYTYSPLLILSYWLVSFLGFIFSPLVLVKIPVLLAELFLAAGFGKIVSNFAAEENRKKIYWRAFSLVYLLPTLILNGAAWGQCDALYCGALIWAVAFFVREGSEGSGKSHLALGLGFALKPQAVFLSPLFLVLYLRKRARPIHLLWIPVIYLFGMLPAFIAGRSTESLVTMYSTLLDIFPYLTMNAPNFYTWIPNAYYSVVYPAGLVFSSVTLLVFCLWFSRHLPKIGPKVVLVLAAFFMWLVPNLLPKMHERYFYCAEILFLALALIENGRRKWIAWVMTGLLQIVTLLTYSHYLYHYDPIPNAVLPLFHFVIGGLWFLYFRNLLKAELKTSHLIDPDSKSQLL